MQPIFGGDKLDPLESLQVFVGKNEQWIVPLLTTQ